MILHVSIDFKVFLFQFQRHTLAHYY